MQHWPEGTDRRVYDTLDSTMAEAARLRETISAPTWIMAHDQTAGRGRRGRQWVQPQGNFSATLLMRPDGPLEARAQRSFVAALALREAFVAATGREAAFTLKWPNDVLLNGGKVAGILLESVGDHLAIGIGVNLTDAPKPDDVEPGAVQPVSLRAQTGTTITAEEMLNLIAPAFARYEAQFITYGFESIRTQWLAQAAKLGEVITARTGTAEFTGTFQTVDGSGALVLKASDGIHHIPAADVYF
ncbi:MAG: biotin--[acetyl-CoA-carboxylase] ligase [Rhodobacterales bacterium]|jgi:BirA family transcriptional regulator, biotin operon repressor / biotin---[acetyl-CoA-carboxylase] ligase